MYFAESPILEYLEKLVQKHGQKQKKETTPRMIKEINIYNVG